MTERIKALADLALRERFGPSPAYVADPGERTASAIAETIRKYLVAQPAAFIEGEQLSCEFHFEGCPVPSCAYRHAGHSSWARFFNVHSDYMPNERCFVDWNHYCINYDFIVNHGFEGYLERIAAARELHAGNAEKLAFVDGMETVCRAIGEWAEKTAEAYESAGRSDIAANCRKVPYHPAESFYEAAQAAWSAFLLLPDSLGRLDQVLWPFYRRDLDAGLITRDEAYELICELFIKVFAHVGPHQHKSGDNTVSVGGYTPSGEDGFNEVSRMILEAIAELPTWRPQASFRFTAKTPPEVMELVTGLNMRCRNIVFTSDEVRVPAFVKLGMKPEDAVGYTMIGCNEWAIPGKSNSGSDGFFNTLYPLEETLCHHGAELDAATDFEGFYAIFEKYLGQYVLFMTDLADAFYEANSGDLNILTSLLIDGCMESGRSVTAGGAQYNVSCWAAVGLIDLADSLSVIKQFVYEEKRFTMERLRSMLRDDWRGHEAERAEILRDGKFFGNGLPEADGLVNRAIASLDALANRRPPRKGGKYRFGCYIGYNGAHVSMGERTGATPNGRRRGDFMTAGVSAGDGKARNGLTAYLRSVASLDYSLLCGPLAGNLRLDGAMKAYPEKLSALYSAALGGGALQLQPDYVSTEELLDAQKNPDKYPFLRVRITGFSAYFTRLPRAQQDEVISRGVR